MKKGAETAGRGNLLSYPYGLVSAAVKVKSPAKPGLGPAFEGSHTGKPLEGLPNSVIESLRCGTPVLASPVGGIPDVIEEGETGWFLPGTTVEAMEAALSGLLKRDDLGDAGGRAEAFARKAFSFEDVLERFRTVFDVDKPAG